jgi:hypothetical protein
MNNQEAVMNCKTIIPAVLLIAICLTMLVPEDAGAIPAFARRHKMSCTTCHAPFPRLKDFGEEFAGNGFTIPEEEKDRDFIIAGDDLLRLNKDVPLAVRFDAYMLARSEASVTTDLQSPWGIKLLSGGNLAKNVGYYFYFFMDERGEVAGVEDAYIHFNNIGGKPWDIMVGQFQTSDPLMKRELRMTFEDYQIYKTGVGRSKVNLTYERGVMSTFDIEKTGTGLIGFVANGNGRAEAGDDKIFDSDKYKNFGGKITQDFGDYAGGGYFYYYGQELGAQPRSAFNPNPVTYKNEIMFHGPDFTLGNGTFDMTFQYLFRRDTNPNYIANPVDVDTKGIIAELVYSPQQDRSRYYYTFLYNQIDSDFDGHDYETATVGATYLMARNLRGTLEYTRNLETDQDRVILGLVSGF